MLFSAELLMLCIRSAFGAEMTIDQRKLLAKPSTHHNKWGTYLWNSSRRRSSQKMFNKQGLMSCGTQHDTFMFELKLRRLPVEFGHSYKTTEFGLGIPETHVVEVLHRWVTKVQGAELKAFLMSRVNTTVCLFERQWSIFPGESLTGSHWDYTRFQCPLSHTQYTEEVLFSIFPSLAAPEPLHCRFVQSTLWGCLIFIYFPLFLLVYVNSSRVNSSWSIYRDVN